MTDDPVPPEKVSEQVETYRERQERLYIESLHEPLFEIE